MSAAATTSSPSVSRRRCRRPIRSVPELRRPGRGDARSQHVPGRQPVARAAEPVRAAVVDRRAARDRRPHDAGAQLHRHARFEPADAAQHRPGGLFDPANPLSVAARKPYPNFVVYIDSDWSGRSSYNAFNTKLEHRGPGAILDARLHVGEEHRPQVGGRGDRGERLQRLAGLPGQRRSRTRLRALGFRRRSPAGRQLRLQPAVRQRRKVRRQRHRREERRRRRLAGQRHLYLAAGLSDHHHGRRCRWPERHASAPIAPISVGDPSSTSAPWTGGSTRRRSDNLRLACSATSGGTPNAARA